MIFHFHAPPRELHPQKVAGRLQFFAQNWQIITQDPWVLQIIQGYEIELLSHPWQTSLPSPPVLSPPQISLVQEEIISLLQKGAIIEVAFNPWVGFYSNLFLVEKKGGKGQRPVINLSRFNNYVEHCHFKMEDLKAVADLLRPGDFMCKLDLKDAYFSVPLHRRSQKFIRFQFQGRTYQFTCLPFGLTSAPRIFTKILKPVTGFLRKMGVRIIVYLDDMLIMNSTLDGARKDIMILKLILENLGFLINLEKSIFVPVQIIEFLGIIVDSTNMRFLLPDEKVAVIQKECRQLVSSQVTSLSQLSHIIGKLTSCKTAVLQAPLHYRGIQHLKNSNMFPQVVNNLNIPLDPHALEDLRWWVDNLYLANGRPIRDSLPHLMIQSDASNSGWGAVSNGVNARGTWTREESNLHINCKELLAASFAVKAFTKELQNVHVLIQIDNTTTIAYINKMGGAKRCLLDHYARHLWGWCLQRRITLRAEHIPGRLNTIADRKSRAKPDSSDWHLNQQSFQILMRDLGRCTIDLFASRTNHQLPRFYSYKPDPEAEAIDALTQPWAGEIGYAFPPFSLVAKCLRKVIHEGATITLVCPVWPTQPWYAQLLQLVVATPILLPTTAGLLIGPQGQEHPLVNNKTLLLAGWRVSGKAFLQKAYQDRLQTLSSLPKELQLRISTSHAGQSGWAGVINDKLIPFNQVLQRL